MDFEIKLTASTLTEDGRTLKEQFDDQLAKFGGDATATILSEVGPFRVDSSGTFGFEIERVYHIVIP